MLLVVISLVIFLQSCTDACYNYDLDSVDDTMHIGYNPKNNEGFIGDINWNFNLDNIDFVIPDTYKGCTIRKFGGYSGTGNPSPFCFYISEAYYDECYSTYEEIPSSPQIIDLTITIKLNKYLNEIEDIGCGFDLNVYFLKDDIYYKINTKLIDNSENETFLVKEDTVYYRKTNELVSEFDNF